MAETTRTSLSAVVAEHAEEEQQKPPKSEVVDETAVNPREKLKLVDKLYVFRFQEQNFVLF